MQGPRRGTSGGDPEAWQRNRSCGWPSCPNRLKEDEDEKEEEEAEEEAAVGGSEVGGGGRQRVAAAERRCRSGVRPDDACARGGSSGGRARGAQAHGRRGMLRPW